MISKMNILEQLEQFKMAKGSIVTVHSSLKAIGAIDGGAETLLKALIEYFTQDGGILCIPTHTWKENVLDLNKADTCIGVLPNVAAAHPDGVRSLNPTHSMVAFGDKKQVNEFVKDECELDSSSSPNGCYGKIYKNDGYIMLIGVGQDKNTFIHCVEEMIGVPNRITKSLTKCAIIHKDGRTEDKLMHTIHADGIPDVSVNYPKFEPAFRYFGCIFDGHIGNADVQLCSATKIKEVVELIYKNCNGTEILSDNLPLDENLYKNRDF